MNRKRQSAGESLAYLLLMLEEPVPRAVRAGLLRAIATLPGITYAGSVRDPLDGQASPCRSLASRACVWS